MKQLNVVSLKDVQLYMCLLNIVNLVCEEKYNYLDLLPVIIMTVTKGVSTNGASQGHKGDSLRFMGGY